MKLTRLRIIGFKSFVEPTDFLIEPGLTGVVGPNGCGKSNLVEALRWVMGETSHKTMRASAMDDVIFSGSGNRPARNTAEVILTADNVTRTAPSGFNDADLLEISRKIEREEGSHYRINGREVRLRDVQIMFADAATGARSPALVRQGQIAEIIAAKPQARRRILEDAAGIAGLHARRHEAELRLKAAEDNLQRAEHVLNEIDSQVESLKKQGRQASRYKNVSAEIRRLEALGFAIGHAEAVTSARESESAAREALGAVAGATEAQTASATAQAIAAAALPKLREAEAVAGATLQRLIHARNEIDAEERRAKDRLADLGRQGTELERDVARHEAARVDAASAIARLDAEASELAQAESSATEAQGAAEERTTGAEAELADSEATLSRLQAEFSDLNARRGALERGLREESERAARFGAEKARLAAELDALAAAIGEPASLFAESVATAEARLHEAEAAATTARETLAAAREAETRARAPLAEADRQAQRLETEARTLAKLFAPPAGQNSLAAIDEIRVAKGFEIALGAALGEDLDAPTDTRAPIHWGVIEADNDPALPDGVASLAAHVEAPPALRRRLAQIGLADRNEGPFLKVLLKPGQRLVSREGDLWRWDGFTAAADAPSAAARRLAERNRLGDLEIAAAQAREAAEARRAEAEAAQAAVREAAQGEAAALEGTRQRRRDLDGAREKLAAAQKREADSAARRSALTEGLERVGTSEREAVSRRAEAQSALDELAPATDLEERLGATRRAVAEQRGLAAQARAALQGLIREAEMAARRRRAIVEESAQWSERAERAHAARAELDDRLVRLVAERQALEEAPDLYLGRRRAVQNEIAVAEVTLKEAADRLVAGESAQTEADRAARAGLEALAAARESRAATQARFEAAGQRVEEITRAIREALDTDPAGLIELAGHKLGQDFPPAAEIDNRLQQLKGDRERLGAVNLRAEDELNELSEKRDSLGAERDDLIEAIKRLRGAIGSLNREGRERLLAAFDVVNGHFQRIFTTLFGGGTAELTLVDSDDPLEAGLDILARPPGKKPQTMTLLSGGEQALTATALIFAVFLTNPSPICVLDEVDAPLDDANVERYCDLLDDMAASTETRFIVITHNPITMARMNRLFGVTMAERGVSQLVSVDLSEAERYREAG